MDTGASLLISRFPAMTDGVFVSSAKARRLCPACQYLAG
jgi:hypothetical protein